MKGLKCIKLLILSTIFLPLFGICSSASALKHDITAIPLYSDGFALSSGGFGVSLQNQPLQFLWIHDYDQISSLSPNSSSWFKSSYNSSSEKCVYDGQPEGRDGYFIASSSSQSSITFRFISYKGAVSTSADFNSALCMQKESFLIADYNHNYLDIRWDHPDFDRSSFYGLTPVTTTAYRSYLPYYYEYSHVLVNEENISSDGVHYSSSLKMSDLLGVIPTKFSRLTIPFDYAEPDVVGDLDSGRVFDFKGIFVFPDATYGEDFSWSSNFLQNGWFRLYSKGLTGSRSSLDSTVYTNYVDCTLNSSQLEDKFQVSYSCPIVLDRDYEVLTFYLDIYSAGDYIFDTSSDWSWSGMRVVTDFDDSPGSPYSKEVTGMHIDQAPGYAHEHESSADWFSSLTNLFSFNIINPFQPIFDMFSGNIDVNNERCASIPTIAGMLNSPESVVCPFFPASIRSIGTSVLGLASTMLIFGFFVHWLGSASGNNIEDSSSHSFGKFNVKKGGKS